MPASRLTAAWCRRSSATSALALVALLSLSPGAGGVSGRTIALHVTIRGDGAVVSGKRTCRSRCTWRVPRGSRRFEARPAMGNLFVRWGGLCASRDSVCVVRVRKGRALVARFAHITDLVSWSSHTTCPPVRTTIPEIVGTAENANHGATEAGGRFQPHFGGLQQHQLNPACEIGGTPTFVEVDDVVMTVLPNRSGDHDDSTNLMQAGRPDITNPNMKTLHAEIDGTWIDGNVAPPLWPNKVGVRLDVQGFVFWDPAHVKDAWHQYSGWELHPVAAWRYSR